MNFFRRMHQFRRYGPPVWEDGYDEIPYTDFTTMADVQTTGKESKTSEDGTESLQRLKVFCDIELLTEDQETQQKADRLLFQGKWFDCTSSRLSENTPLRHWTATFVQCERQDPAPGGDTP